MLRIWGRPTSICTQRVLWACVEAGLDFELVLASATMGAQGHVSGGGAPYGVVDTPAYRAMNPNGTVPTVDDDGFVLWDSVAILDYLALRHAPERLFGGSVETFAQAAQWMSWTNEHLEPPLHDLVMHLVRLPTTHRRSAVVETARKRILPALDILDRHLARQSHVAGDIFSVGDIPAGAAVHRWLLFDLERPDMPALLAWHARLGGREGFRRHVAPPEYHLGPQE